MTGPDDPERSTLDVRVASEAVRIFGLDLTADQLKAYLKLKQADDATEAARHARRKDWFLTRAAVIGLSVVAAACLLVIGFRGDDEGGRQAWSTLLAIVSGAFSFLAGRASKGT